MWFVYALGSAVFAALTSILAKIGIDGVNSTPVSYTHQATPGSALTSFQPWMAT